MGREPFEIWIDDRFAAPENNPGPAYYDYLRFVPVPQCSANVRREEAYSGLELWLNRGKRGFEVFIGDPELSGFVREANGGRLRGAEPGDSFTCVVKTAGGYWPALAMTDAAAVMEELSVTVNGSEAGRIAATGNEDEPAPFCFRQPLELSADEVRDDAKRQVTEATGLPADRMLMSGTHTHLSVSARWKNPFQPEKEFTEYQRFVADRIADGVRCAIDNLRPARVAGAVADLPAVVDEAGH